MDRIRDRISPWTLRMSRQWDLVLHRLTHNRLLNVGLSQIRFFNRFDLQVTNKRRESSLGYLFILLWLIGFSVFAFYPVFYSLYLSLFKVRFDGADLNLVFVGIQNYQASVLQDPYFIEILISYVFRLLLNLPVTIVFALIIAMLINQNIKGKGIWRTIFFLPVIISSGPVIGELINQGATTLPSIESYGFIEFIVNNVGTFLASPIEELFNQILLVLWFAGIQILILLAGLQKIDRAIYEAAMIDGASAWEAFFKITLPSIKPLIIVSVIYTVVSMSVFSLNEVIIYIRNIMLSESTPALTTGYGYSATLSWVYFLTMAIIMALFVGALSIEKKEVH